MPKTNQHKTPLPSQVGQLKKLPFRQTLVAQTPRKEGQASKSIPGSEEEMQLEKVIGTSSKNANAIQVNPVNGDLVFLAGSYLVVYSPKDAKQTHFLSSPTSRPFQCLVFSSCGKYLAAGESAFRQPQITIWEITYEEITLQQRTGSVSGNNAEPQEAQQPTTFKKATEFKFLKQLKGHKYGIECLRFAPNNDFLISLGDPNDRGMFCWDWKEGKKISANKLTKPATVVAISPD